MRVIEADSRVSPVSALKANPRTAMRYVYKECLDFLVSISSNGFSYLARDGVEEGVDNTLREATFLIFVHFNYLLPVSCNLREVQAFGKVDEVKNVLLEAASTEADRSAKELGTHTRVLADSVGNFVNVGTSCLTDGRKCVD